MSPSSVEEHRERAAEQEPVRIALLTISDSRSVDSDPNGAFLRAAAEGAGHEVVLYRVVPDDPDRIIDSLGLAAREARIVILNGGTGIARRDNTYDVVAARLEKVMTGFGELFRMLSWDQVGSAAMLSRATAGVYRESVVFCLPGSPKAVRLAWERLIEPELEHVAWEVGK